MLAAAAAVACSKSPEVAKRQHLERADAYLAEKKYKEAVVELRNVIQLDPSDGHARLKLARTYRALEEWPMVYREQVRAADLLPDDLDAQLEAAEILLLAKKYEDARARVERALVLDERNVRAHLLKGNIAARLDDLPAGTGCAGTRGQHGSEPRPDLHGPRAITAGERRHESGRRGFQQGGGAGSQLGRRTIGAGELPVGIPQILAAAEASLIRAMELDPKDLTTRVALSRLLVATGRVPEAEQHVKAAAEISTDPRAQLTLADFYFVAGKFPESTAVLTPLRESKDTNVRTQATLRLAMLAVRQRQPCRGGAID